MCTSLKLPSNIVPLDHQLAGHFSDKGKNVIGMFKDTKTGFILKSISNIRGRREHYFYEKVWSTKDSKLQQFIPKFFGIIQINDINFIQIADITNGFGTLNNMDIKVGAITYDPEADSEKIKREINKYQWMTSLGFRISGIRIHDPVINESVYFDKYFGRKLNPDKVFDMLNMFVSKYVNKTRRLEIINQYIKKLNSLKEWFVNENINNLKFIASSLLFVHSTNDGNLKLDLKMIDFAHIFPNQNQDIKAKLIDDNYIYGLNKLLERFYNLKNI